MLAGLVIECLAAGYVLAVGRSTSFTRRMLVHSALHGHDCLPGTRVDKACGESTSGG